MPKLCSLMGTGFVCDECSFLEDPKQCDNYVFSQKLLRAFIDCLDSAHIDDGGKEEC